MPSGASPRATRASAARTLSARATCGATAVPDAEALERRLAVEPGRDVIGVAHREAAAAERACEIEAGRDLERGLAVRRRHQHQAVAEQIGARAGADQAAFREVVHPFRVGGDEDVGRGALLDLAR